jgi:3-dehydroquinate synthase
VHTLKVDVGHTTYPIVIGSGLLGHGELLNSLIPKGDVAVVTNTTVAALYLDKLRSALSGRRIAQCVLPDGEQFKNQQTLGLIYDALVESRLNRDVTILALGGGVVGDMAGFAAASYQRGVGYVQIPTTLLALVDSSVGGKTGVNHPGGKNLIGAFYQPLAVIGDIDTLATLPDRELRAGLAEVIKYGCVWDPVFFDWLESHIDKLIGRDIPSLIHQSRRGGQGRARKQSARRPQFWPYLRTCHRVRHPLRNLPARRGGGLGHAHGQRLIAPPGTAGCA